MGTGAGLQFLTQFPSTSFVYYGVGKGQFLLATDLRDVEKIIKCHDNPNYKNKLPLIPAQALTVNCFRDTLLNLKVIVALTMCSWSAFVFAKILHQGSKS